MAVKVVLKGGSGSGNFGHAGRPGEVGGSQLGRGGNVRHDLIGKAIGYRTVQEFYTNITPSISYNEAKGVMRAIKTAKITSYDLEQGEEYLGHILAGYGIKSGINMRSDPYNWKIAAKILYREWPENTSSMRTSKVLDLLSRFGFDRNEVFIAKFDMEDIARWERVADLDQVRLNPALRKEYIEKGGSGSGNFGHQGRPGEVGGSASVNEGDVLVSRATSKKLTITKVNADGSVKVAEKPFPISRENLSNYDIESKPIKSSDNVVHNAIDDMPYRDGWKAYFIRKDGKLIEVQNKSMEHEQIARDNPELLGLTQDDVKSSSSSDELWDKITLAGNIRVRFSPTQVNIDNLPITTSGLRSIQKWVDNDKLPSGSGLRYFWTDSFNQDFKGIKTTYEEIMTAKYVNKGELKEQPSKLVTLKGGPGSGNFGHSGRPGEVGGSSSEGGGEGHFRAGSGDYKFTYYIKPTGYYVDPLDPNIRPIIYETDNKLGRLLNGLGSEIESIWDVSNEEDRALIKAGIISTLSKASGVDEAIVNDVIGQWAHTSNDNDMRSLSLQEACSEEFGVEMSEWQAENLNALKEEIRDSNDPFSRIRNSLKYQQITSRENERAILRSMYENTQAELARQGLKPDDEVTLYRGVVGNRFYAKLNSVASYKGNSMESWSISKSAADSFANSDRGNEDGFTLGMRVSVRNILGSARTGFGCLNEGEYILFGTIPGTTAKVLTIYPGQ